MTRDEAKAIARIVGTADGSCSTCVGKLVEKLNAAKLGWTFTLDKKTLFVFDDVWEEGHRRTCWVRFVEAV